MEHWEINTYQQIEMAKSVENDIVVTFKNGDEVIVTRASVVPSGYHDIDWDELTVTPFEVIVPASPHNIEIMWDTIRSMTDVEFSRFLAGKAEEEAKKIGQKIKSLRERKGIRSNDLAEKSGLTPQTISRIENGRTDVGFATLKKILVAMGYNLRDLANEEIGESDSRSFHQLIRKLSKIGIDAKLLTSKIIPKNIQEALTGYRDKEPELLLNEATSYLTAIYGWPQNEIWENPNLIVSPEPAELAFFKKKRNSKDIPIKAYSHYAYYLAKVALRGFQTESPIDYPQSLEELKNIYYKKYNNLNLSSLLELVWDMGICVLPLCDAGVFHGASWNIDGRHVIILKQRSQSHAKWIFDLLHELYHVFVHLHEDNSSVVEANEISPISDNDTIEELEANAFANQFIFDNKAEEIAEKCVSIAKWDLKNLPNAVRQVAETERIREDFVANYVAFRLSLQGENWWASANKFQIIDPEPFSNAVKILRSRINFNTLSPIDRNLMASALLNN